MNEDYPPALVVDATLLINFARIEHLELLERTRPELWCPEVVWNQTVTKSLPGYDVEAEMKALCQSGKICIKEVDELEQLQFMNQFLKRMDEGEADALALAVTRKLPVASDDKACRTVAKKYGLNITGTIG